jgi:hypothetical protein
MTQRPRSPGDFFYTVFVRRAKKAQHMGHAQHGVRVNENGGYPFIPPLSPKLEAKKVFLSTVRKASEQHSRYVSP